MSKSRVTCLLLLLGGVAILEGPAIAAPVDNPGQFVWALGGGYLEFNQTSPIQLTLSNTYGTWDSDIDSNGDIVFNNWVTGVTPIPGTGYSAQILVDSASSFGNLDASLGPSYNTSLTIHMRIKITGGSPSVGSTCTTPFFDAPFEGAYQLFMGDGLLELYTGTGGSAGGTSGWLKVPAITASCAGQAATINSLLKFDGSSGGIDISRLGGRVTSGPQGS